MTARVDLVLLAHDGPESSWTLGQVFTAGRSPTTLGATAGRVREGPADAVLWWDPGLGPPPSPVDLLDEPDDAWHAGLRLGQGGRPGRLRHVAPAWMLAADPPEHLSATSWRVSLRACLVRTAVLRELGGPDPCFSTIAGAGLEVGHRWSSRGARCRYEPGLVTGPDSPEPDGPPGDEDELRFIERRFGPRWAVVSAVSGRHRIRSLRRVPGLAAEPRAASADLAPAPIAAPSVAPSVSVVVPTIDRYPWLNKVLGQLAGQTMSPAQVIVVDQTPRDRREGVRQDDLPLEVVIRDRPGQSSARNAALERATGDLVLFIDDDDEIDADLIERHAAVVEHRRVDVSCGVAHEPGDPPLTEEFRRFRTADVFPTNNTMVRRDALALSGWFDQAFDHGVRADHDLGTRLYLAGARMVLSPDIEVVHHRAARGGLRTDGVRRVTAASSRRSLTARQPISATEVYLWGRHHPSGVRPAVRLRLLGNLRGDGPTPRRLLRAMIQIMLLPRSIMDARRAAIEAGRLAARHPTIPHRPTPGA